MHIDLRGWEAVCMHYQAHYTNAEMNLVRPRIKRHSVRYVKSGLNQTLCFHCSWCSWWALQHARATLESLWDRGGIALESLRNLFFGVAAFSIRDQNKTGMTKQCVRMMCQTHAQPRARVSRARCSFSIILCQYFSICIYLTAIHVKDVAYDHFETVSVSPTRHFM
jgi:hypothetical protein